MSSLDLEPQPQVLRFPGGGVAKTKPSRESLEDSLQAWAAVASTNAQQLMLDPSAHNVRALRSATETMERTLRELGEW